MKKICKLLPVLLLPCPAAAADDVQRQDQLVWDYWEFVQAFADRDWAGAGRFVGPETKIGFGGDVGRDGLERVFGDDDDCHAATTRILELGCRKTGTGRDMHCQSPPFDGPDVVYIGPRASFRYNENEQRWMAVYLVCGGD